jgi:hypothetical protein
MNLLDHYTLHALQPVKLYAEWLRWMAPNVACQARVELKLAPMTPLAPLAFEYNLQARLHCLGLPTAESPETEAYFVVEVVLNATYRENGPASLNFETFSREHVSLARQLHPLLHVEAQSLLNQLGLPQIRLPPDLSPVETPPERMH